MNKKRIKNYILIPFKLIKTLFLLGIYYLCMPGWHFVEYIDRRIW